MLGAERYRRTELLNSLTIQVQLWEQEKALTWWIWKLIPMKAEGMPTPASQSPLSSSGSPPTYDGDTAGQSSAHAQHTESERGDFGTIVTEVTTTTNTNTTTTTTTTTTRKEYRVQDA